jgi:AraC-like DNA-binding protein
MKRDFKYLTTSDEDINWGLYLNVAGYAEVLSDTEYPSLSHPSGYYFNWNQGRILNEFQVNYITHGGGILETKNGKFTLQKGTIFFTLPGEWHRYKPFEKTGWTEYYLGFDGLIARQLFSNPVLTGLQPMVNIGLKEEYLEIYQNIFDLIEKEKPGYQQIASGLILKLLGYIVSFQEQKEFSGKEIATIIEETRFYMRQKIDHELNLEELARNKNVGYSYFRRMFKKYTGVSPGQYHLQLRIMRAKELLVSTEKSIKEISYELNFQSIFYFSSIFKQKEGITPTQFRKKNIQQV